MRRTLESVCKKREERHKLLREREREREREEKNKEEKY
jgi:hypothetical protein